ncbi:MAG: polyphosphate polymerase domain-containing protein [Lachnospiraceae bacterium]|nr:polyphosphate polymerase domain-containing protein [Lachnospiraceae bacterium]
MPNIFKRSEVKYLLTAEQRRAVEAVLKDHMIPDEHGESTIRNIYFDTPSWQLIRNSIEKPVYKEKLRMRSYKRTSESDKVFLELKKKYDGIVYKRRIEVREKDFADYLDGKREFPEKGQIADEIDYFCRFYKKLVPAVYLCYDRCALFDKDDESLRITFDRNIRWRTYGVSLTEEAGGTDILDEGMSLMEIKAADAMPLWLVKVLNENNIRKVSFSKYGTAYRQMLEGGNITGFRNTITKTKEAA